MHNLTDNQLSIIDFCVDNWRTVSDCSNNLDMSPRTAYIGCLRLAALGLLDAGTVARFNRDITAYRTTAKGIAVANLYRQLAAVINSQ